MMFSSIDRLHSTSSNTVKCTRYLITETVTHGEKTGRRIQTRGATVPGYVTPTVKEVVEAERHASDWSKERKSTLTSMTSSTQGSRYLRRFSARSTMSSVSLPSSIGGKVSDS